MTILWMLCHWKNLKIKIEKIEKKDNIKDKENQSVEEKYSWCTWWC